LDIIEWIKANVKEGANVAEAEELVKDLDPLKNITTAESALAFIDRNSVFKSALDAETSRRVLKHDEKFQAEKLPEILKAERGKLEKELNPDLTPEQKRIAELEEWQQDQLLTTGENQLKESLRAKAKEIGYDPLRAETLYIYGDNALKMLEEEKGYFDSKLKTELEAEIKTRFAPNVPDRGTRETAADLQTQYDEAIKAGEGSKAFMLKEQLAKQAALENK